MDEDSHDIELQAIARRIKDLRIGARFSSHEKFANEYGFQLKQYWRLESGKDFKITTLIRIAKCHNLTLEEFFKGL